MAGPWDRAYGYDMNRYVSLMALWFWVLIGKEKSSMIKYVRNNHPTDHCPPTNNIAQPQVMSHSADYAYAPCFAVLAAFHRTLVPTSVLDHLGEFTGEHTFVASTYYPPIDNVPRNITTWLSDNLTIGAESYDENGLGGPSLSQEAFNPAVIQWNTGSETSFISVSLLPVLADTITQSQQTPTNVDIPALPHRILPPDLRIPEPSQPHLPLRQQ